MSTPLAAVPLPPPPTKYFKRDTTRHPAPKQDIKARFCSATPSHLGGKVLSSQSQPALPPAHISRNKHPPSPWPRPAFPPFSTFPRTRHATRFLSPSLHKASPHIRTATRVGSGARRTRSRCGCGSDADDEEALVKRVEYICDLIDARGVGGEGLWSRGLARGGAADVGMRAEWVVWWASWRFLLLEGKVRMMEERREGGLGAGGWEVVVRTWC